MSSPNKQRTVPVVGLHMQEESPITTFNYFIDVMLLPELQRFIKVQYLQVWMRIGLLVMFTLFTVLHGGFSDTLMPLIVVSGSSYLILNLVSFYWIRHVPYSLIRIVTIPIFDYYLIVLAMLGDGGQMSVVYFLLMSPIIGNGLRYGSKMLTYSQILGLIAMGAISVLTVFLLHQAIDWIGLTVQLFAILYISSYAYGIIRRTESTVQEKHAAEDSANRLISDAPHPAFTFDIQSEFTPIIYANSAMATLITAQPESLPGTPIEQLVIPEDRLELRHAVVHQLQSSAMAKCYIRIPDNKGNSAQVRCEIRRTFQSGKQIGLCYLTDISESERLQGELAEAQQQSQVAALAAGVAHDFRNLLSAIIGHAELIGLEHDQPQLQKDIQQIIKAGQRGSDMVEQLLQLGRNQQSDFKVLNVAKPISKMVQLARVQLPPDIDLAIQVDKKLPKVRVNLAQIEQVILNLVSNAAHAMQAKKGKISIRLSPNRSSADGSGLCIALRDSGCGIKPDDIQFIFKPFWSSRKDVGGTGLGLAMVQRIIRWHHGHIDVESIPDHGTVFNIFLPEYVEEKQPDKLPEKQLENASLMPTDTDALQSWDILLVEDQAEVREVHQIFLSKMRQRVHTACNGKSAYAMIEQQEISFDMVLTDYMMPEMDGIALTKAIRTQDSNLPVTILTAFSEDSMLNGVKDSNTYILSKPLSYHQLHAHVRRLQCNRVPKPVLQE